MTRLRHACHVVGDLAVLAGCAALYAACSVGQRRRRARVLLPAWPPLFSVIRVEEGGD